jgi:YHS domain-containing protein
MKQWMILGLLLLSGSLVAQDKTTIRKQQYNIASDGLAIKGFDPVAYFTEQKAVKGKTAFAVSHQGVLYHFATAANKELFKKNPAAYEPQYGGWCAFAMGDNGEKVQVDPETFKILNGKLYLFYNRLFTNTLTNWNKDEKVLNSKADQNWKKYYL